MKTPCLIFFMLFTIAKLTAMGDSTLARYQGAYNQLDSILQYRTNKSFAQAVFLVENTYLNSRLTYQSFDSELQQIVFLAEAWMAVNHIKNYKYPDSFNVLKNAGIYAILKDSITFDLPQAKITHLPYSYDFTDFDGTKDWCNMFVTKLFSTHTGNCHSLPYLYKILADELGATCWLALAPNHMYIKNRCKGGGWYNTELTSGTFPVDAWIMTSGYVTVEAVQHGIYMDTLSNQQSIALCALDLAKEYEHQTKNYYDGFIIKCCDLSLQYFPLNVQAMLLKAETLKRVYERQANQKSPDAKDTYNEMQDLYLKLLDLGYQEMPDKMYQKWLLSVQKEKEKYTNKKIPAH